MHSRREDAATTSPPGSGSRIAEHSTAAMVLGEKLSTIDLVAYFGLGRTPAD
ncbi:MULTISPECIES: hypothetical protein [Microbacterium]|uniref:hypothetical protein n=1 Tax=Microbacterium TaxID=33882 RepID=UPI0014307EB4|nr:MULTISPECIES: hypothetical protein [Microbacterium]MCK6067384.1 hypothetical protein [Microbacterium sp. EYE_512]